MSPFDLDSAARIEGPDDPVEALLAEADDDDETPEPVHWSVLLDQALARIESGEKPEVIPTPFSGLNTFLGGGFRKQELVLLGGSTSGGKSSIIGQFAVAAVRANQPILLASLEMGDLAVVQRMLAQQARVFAANLRENAVSDVDKARLRSTVPALRTLPVYMTDRATSIRKIVKMVARRSKTGGLGVLFVDYLQLVSAPRTIRDRRLQVEYVNKVLRRLAIHFNMCVIAVSALKRLPNDEEPDLSSLRESGDLEYSADVVLLLSRERGQRETKCVVAKQRNGPTGQVELIFEWEYTRFQEG